MVQQHHCYSQVHQKKEERILPQFFLRFKQHYGFEAIFYNTNL